MFFMTSYLCPGCGVRSESLEDRKAIPETKDCPCGDRTERTIAAANIGTKYGWAGQTTRGTDDRPPGVMDTRAIADGMPTGEWKRRRAKRRVKQMYSEIKKAVE